MFRLTSGEMGPRRGGGVVTRASVSRVARVVATSSFAVLVLACTPAVAAQACQNEQLRTELHSGQLPDCRAYEMITPPFKAGDAVHVWAISEDGASVLGASFGAFAGTESNEFQAVGEAATYIFTRTASGWSAAPLAPSASRFPSNKLVAETPDLASTLWLLRTPQQPYRTEADIYLRMPDGAFVQVGPTQPSVKEEQFAGIQYVDASRSLDDVFFKDLANEEGAFLWPGDTTAAPVSKAYPSLYEYSGTGNSEPFLVGVSNVGTLHGSPHVNEGAELISQCGTELGSEASTYNAVSESGATVFFTARGVEDEACGREAPAARAPADDELYARLSGSETVDISEPSTTDCEVCNTTSEPARAVFQGASEDGSKVFFTTEQQLLAGATGENLYEYDFAAPPASAERPDGRITLISAGAAPAEVKGVARISGDGSHVYFVAGGVLTGPNAEARTPVAEQANLYCYDTVSGRTEFIGTLGEEDTAVWKEIDKYRPAESTPDGEYFVFTSYADLTPGDTSTVKQVFEYDARTERLQRISIGQDGYDDDGNTTEEADAASLGVEPQSFGGGASAGVEPSKTEAARAISEDGSRVFFESADALTPQTIAGLPSNVYEWEREGTGSCPPGLSEGCVYLLSDGRDASTSAGGASVRLIGTDRSGEDVLFTTADQLIRGDTDTQLDVYDARVEGGFPEPQAPIACSGSACQDPVNLTPPPPSDQSASTVEEAVVAGPPAVSTGGPPKKKAQTVAQRLANALKSCRVQRDLAKRHACEAQARRRYRAKPTKRQRPAR